jgi:hypothetical protein
MGLIAFSSSSSGLVTCWALGGSGGGASLVDDAFRCQAWAQLVVGGPWPPCVLFSPVPFLLAFGFWAPPQCFWGALLLHIWAVPRRGHSDELGAALFSLVGPFGGGVHTV